MVTTIKINDKDVEITLTPEQVEAITKASEPEIRLKGGLYIIYGDGTIRINNTAVDYIENGTSFKTKELAEQASKDMRRANRLRALARQIEPNWVDKGIGTYAWYAFKVSNEYRIYHHVDSRAEGLVYMSKDTAITICDYLNKGLFDLNGE